MAPAVPDRARTLADEVSALLASGEAWADEIADAVAVDVDVDVDVDVPAPLRFAPVVELGFRDGAVMRLDPYGTQARDLQRVARALVLPAPPTD